MAFLHALKEFALSKNPATIPPSSLLQFTDTTVTIFDKYPKSSFHFLVLPRPNAQTELTASVLHDLKTLLKWDKSKALDVLKDLEAEGSKVEDMIKDEMHKNFGGGCEWEIFTGFHAIPSMHHVHLHVISSDYVSPSLKNKKHWNSFNPKLGFFLHLKDVLRWFDLPDAEFSEIIKFPEARYEPLLKSNLQCWRCNEKPANIPKLKTHLQTHLDRDIATAKKKRKREEIEAAKAEAEDAPSAKAAKTE